MTLIAIEILIIWLLSKMTHHFAWWIIEISGPSIGVKTFPFIARSLTCRITEVSLVLALWTAILFLRFVRSGLFQINYFVLLWCLRIWASLFRVILGDLRLRSVLTWFFIFFSLLRLWLAHHFLSFCVCFKLIIHNTSKWRLNGINSLLFKIMIWKYDWGTKVLTGIFTGF